MTNNLIEHSLARCGLDLRVAVSSTSQAGGGGPACAAIYGRVTDDCLVRIHSRCLYSEAFRSEDCDCAAQLHRSIDLIDEEGGGVVIYLDQEGRGAGLSSKARAYALSDLTGRDSYASYEELGLPLDSRSFDEAANMVLQLGLKSVRLLTNNPWKVEALDRKGVHVKVERLVVPMSVKARKYLESKRKHGYCIDDEIASCSELAVFSKSGNAT
jgi:GTP cyclohydrolase II